MFDLLQVENATLTRDCATVTVATVNGMSPGPVVEIDEGDTLVVKVTNKQVYPVTMHWYVSLFWLVILLFLEFVDSFNR